MKTINGTVLTREDLLGLHIKTPFEKIGYEMFAICYNGIMLPDDIILFNDDDGRTKIIKSRFNMPVLG